MDTNIDFLHLGIPVIDSQHQRFFSLLNKLKLYNDNSEGNEKVYEIFKELKEYTHVHFKEEAKLMEKLEFDGINEHLEQHNLFIKKISEFETTYRYESQEFSNQMLTFLQKWFLGHIAGSDIKYAEFAKQKGIKLG